MKRIFVVSLLMFCSTVDASMLWQKVPADKTEAGGHSNHGRSAGHTFLLKDGTGAEMDIWLPTQVRRPLKYDKGDLVKVAETGVSSYHLLQAIKRDKRSEQVALRYVSMHGKPSGVSPAVLVDADKARLEIMPAPLTREHQRYISNKAANYIVRFRGKPLPGKKITLHTSNGSTGTATTDENGFVSVLLPDDFKDVQAGRSNNSAAEFFLTTEHVAAGRKYQTSLSADYYVNPSHWQSFGGGLLAMFAGVVSGLFVIGRVNKKQGEKA